MNCAMLRERAVFPIPGLAATTIKSDFCNPEVALCKKPYQEFKTNLENCPKIKALAENKDSNRFFYFG